MAGSKRRLVAAVLERAWLPLLVIGLLACSTIDLVSRLMESDCEMTWMYSWPHYQRLNLSPHLRRSFPQYSLHYYLETRNKEEHQLDSIPLKLSGLPVLFIPGNAGSHKQVRSSASIALQMHRHEFSHLKHFDFFTVNLNEEFSGLFGGVLLRQTEFVVESIKHILSLYSSLSSPRPNSVLIIAHSMGGVVAQLLFTLPELSPSMVSLVVTLSSPLARPVIAFDPLLHHFYHRIDKVWYNEMGVASNVTLVSISGGDSDVQVPFHLTIPPSPTSHSHLITSSSAIPRNWVPADHRAIVWCRRAQLALIRALFMLQTLPTNKLTSDLSKQRKILHHLLFKGWTVPIDPSNILLNSDLWKMVNEMPFYHETKSHTFRALPLSTSSTSSSSTTTTSSSSSDVLLVATDTPTNHWLYLCSNVPRHRANCSDFSHLAHVLPPREKVVKYVLLEQKDLANYTHVVMVTERSKGQMKEKGKNFMLMEWCGQQMENQEFSMPIWGSTELLHISPPHCALTRVLLPQLNHLWTSHSALVTSCPGVKGGLILPRLPHTPLHHDNGSGQLEIHLSMQAPLKEGVAELFIWSPSNCSVTVTVSLSLLPLAGKLLVLYTPLLLPWVTAIAVASLRNRNLLRDVGLLVVVWGATYIGVPPWTDWEKLTSDGLWTAVTPPLLHLVAHGIFSLLRTLSDVISSLLSLCCRSSVSEKMMNILVVVVYSVSVTMCSSAGVLCVLTAYIISSSKYKERKYVLNLLCCLSVLSLPSLASWLKNIRYSFQLSPDPLFWPLTVASSIALLFLLLPPPYGILTLFSAHLKISTPMFRGCGFTMIPLSLISSISLLSLSILLYCTVHTYRIVVIVAAAMLFSPFIQPLPPKPPQSLKKASLEDKNN